jgi:hypothetical protein
MGSSNTPRQARPATPPRQPRPTTPSVTSQFAEMARDMMTAIRESCRAEITAQVSASASAQRSSIPSPFLPDHGGIVAIPNVRWGDLPQLDVTKTGEIDNWFQLFENLMLSWKIAEENWAACFTACDRVAKRLKSALTPEAAADYRVLRSQILSRYGPKVPVGYYMAQLHQIKGNTREEVFRIMDPLRELYDRAARDAGMPPIREIQLLYPFTLAFPPDVGSSLQQHLGAAQREPKPLEALYDLAPSETSGRPLLAAMTASNFEHGVREVPEQPIEQESRPAPVPPIAGMAEALQAALMYMTAANTAKENTRGRETAGLSTSSRFVKRQGGARSCTGCGGTCVNLEACPAQGKTCGFCQKPNHFARACRAKTAAERRPGQDRPFRRPGGPPRRQ